MSGAKRTRHGAHPAEVTIPIGTALSNAFEFETWDKLIIHMPAAWTAADIGFQVSNSEAGTFLPLYDAAGALIEYTPAVDTAFLAPAGIAGAYWIKLWSQTAGVDTNQAAARTLGLTAKS